MIDFVDEKAFRTAEDRLQQEAFSHDTKLYEDWARYHASLVQVASRYGVVTDHWEGGDFFHTLDWFTSLTDNFSLLTPDPLKRIRLGTFQDAIAQHSAFGLLEIGGERSTPVDGLEILIHPKVVLMMWRGKTRDECREHLLSMGLSDGEHSNRASPPST